jgi:indolepyruvate ferredoxin oxidoreductase beta subunit|uniref:Indolepyruvate oxidoreductase subunit beta n=1 Tax=candidate division WOR-3 bacterium TaxID=2052148 RepID=A0A7C6A9M2_UNCW3
MNKKNTNILVCGVGGQGVLLFSDLLAEIAMKEGLDVKKSEVHGMAQRGGSVTSHIRFGEKVYSPLITEGTANFIVSLEKLEALRYLHFLAPNGVLLTDNLIIEPLPVIIGIEEMPKDIDERIKHRVKKYYLIDAFAKAKELGNTRVSNMIMLGALSNFLDFTPNTYHRAIRENVKERFVDINIKAFELGVSLLR